MSPGAELSKPRFISMAELSGSRVMQFLFELCPGSKDRLMDILKLGAPQPTSHKCRGRHHPLCTKKYGCIGERRLLLPSKFAIWIGECEQQAGVSLSAMDGKVIVQSRGVDKGVTLTDMSSEVTPQVVTKTIE